MLIISWLVIDVISLLYWHESHISEGSVGMRGDDEQSGHLFSYLSPEQRLPIVHPLRTIRAMTDDVLRRLSPRFDATFL
jgi:hypothetical protein